MMMFPGIRVPVLFAIKHLAGAYLVVVASVLMVLGRLLYENYLLRTGCQWRALPSGFPSDVLCRCGTVRSQDYGAQLG